MNQQQNIASDKKNIQVDLKSQIQLKKHELSTKEKTSVKYQKQLESTKSTLTKNNQRIHRIDLRRRKLEENRNQKLENKKMAEERVNQKKTKVDITEQNLQHATQACKDKQIVYENLNRTKTTINKKLDRCREEHIEAGKKLEKGQKKWSMENVKIRRMCSELHQTKMAIKTCKRTFQIHNQQESYNSHDLNIEETLDQKQQQQIQLRLKQQPILLRRGQLKI
jgi:hypothetical protein